MSSKIVRATNIFIAIIQIIAIFLLMVDNPKGSPWLLFLAIVTTLISFVRLFIWYVDLYSSLGMFILYIQLLISFGISMLDGHFAGQIYLFVLIGEATFHFSLRSSILFTTLCYLSFAVGKWIYFDFPVPMTEISYVLPRSMEYIAFFGFSHLAKIAHEQKEKLEQAHDRLRKASLELEEKVLLQERTRISREIHDTVGYTLTAALAGLQSGIKLIDSDKKTAKEIMGQAREQVQKGLQDVRLSVHMLKKGPSFPSFIPSLLALVEETKRHTHLDIACTVAEDIPKLNPKEEMAIYRAAQEGFTNGIKHGDCTQFHLVLYVQNSKVIFQLSDNGSGMHELNFGFGLTSMKERVEEAGGEFTIISNIQEGTRIQIEIPVDHR